MVVCKGPVRSAVAFIFFCIAGAKGPFWTRAFQIRLTVSSESPSTSATMRQPETEPPLGFTPTRRSRSITNWTWMSRGMEAVSTGRWDPTGFLAGLRLSTLATSSRHLERVRGDGLAPVLKLLPDAY